MIKQFIRVLLALIMTLSLKAQDPQFTQFYASPMYLNPAYTGNTIEHRFVANYRNQWPGISKTYQTYMASYDYNLSDLKSGVGFSAMQDRSGTAGLTHTQIGLFYAYHANITKKVEFRSGINFSFNFKSIDFTKLTFNDQLVTGAPVSMEATNYEKLFYMDVNAGAMINSTKFWVGIAAKHLNQPNSSLIGDRVPLPTSISIHGGYRYIIEARSRGVLKRYISPAFNYRHEQKYDQFDIGVYYFHLPVNLGVWYRGLPFKHYAPAYRNNESIALLLGFELTRFDMRVGYSYDITVSGLGVASSKGAHEVSLIYEIARKKKRRARVMVSCPKF